MTAKERNCFFQPFVFTKIDRAKTVDFDVTRERENCLLLNAKIRPENRNAYNSPVEDETDVNKLHNI